ncbi:MAG: ribosome biogenesis GTPase YlqF [Victivallales bacterium]|nr:ribosome biogenesis GTPase YlqF [Victivallales bacterium]
MRDDFSSYALSGWFPGHMHKARKQLQDALKLIDLAVELVDARAPMSTRNPQLAALLSGKPRVVLANKADLASPAGNRAWMNFCQEKGISIQFLDARKPGSLKALTASWRNCVLEARAAKGATRPLVRPIRIIIAGVPNVGKSTLVNHLNDHNTAQVGAKPGVTRTNQWIPLGNGIELLDTPGILWPSIKDKKHELMLALLDIMNNEVISRELIADFLAWKLENLNINFDWNTYGLTQAPDNGDQLLEAIANKRKYLLSGGKLDTERAAFSFIKDFRDGKMGRITLEMPQY